MTYTCIHKKYTNEPLEEILSDYPELKGYFYGTKMDLKKIEKLTNPSLVYDYKNDEITKYDLINFMLDRLEMEGIIHDR